MQWQIKNPDVKGWLSLGVVWGLTLWGLWAVGQGYAITVFLILAGWLLIGGVWGFVMVNRRAFQDHVKNRYWGYMHKLILAQYQNWVRMHSGITADYYHENKWNELRQNAIESPEAQEGCKEFIKLVSQAVLVCSIVSGPVAVLQVKDLKDEPCRWYQP